MSLNDFLSDEHLVQYTWSFVPWRQTLASRGVDSNHSSWLLHCITAIDRLTRKQFAAAGSTLERLPNLVTVESLATPGACNSEKKVMQIPPLHNLHNLVIHWRRLHTVIPLQNLRCLDLSWCRCQMTGRTAIQRVNQFQNVLIGMPQLEEIYLTGCSQYSEYDFGYSEEQLDGEGLLTAVTGSLPSMRHLRVLDLAYCTAGDLACAALAAAAARAPSPRQLHVEGNCAQPTTLIALAELELEACDALQVIQCVRVCRSQYSVCAAERAVCACVSLTISGLCCRACHHHLVSWMVTML